MDQVVKIAAIQIAQFSVSVEPVNFVLMGIVQKGADGGDAFLRCLCKPAFDIFGKNKPKFLHLTGRGSVAVFLLIF